MSTHLILTKIFFTVSSAHAPCGLVCFCYLGGLQGARHQSRHTAYVSEDSLAANVGPPGQVPQDAGHHLMKLLTV